MDTPFATTRQNAQGGVVGKGGQLPWIGLSMVAMARSK